MIATSQPAGVGRDHRARRAAIAWALGVIVPALALHFAPESLRAAMLYQREAIAAGEWWRLATGHWVHFSATHLLLNVFTLLGAGLWLERIRPGELGRYLAIAAPVLGGMLWLLEPAMDTFGGLSGLACGVLVLAALTQWREASTAFVRICAAALLVVIAMKSIGDLSAHSFSVVAFDASAGVRVSVWAHAAGAGLGLAFFLSRLRRKSCPLPPAGVFSP